MFRLAAFASVVLLTSVPLAAQEDEPPSLMERGADMFLEGLLDEMQPALKDMKEFLDQMGPAMTDLMDQIEDWSAYAPPEVLPNGDIIIRRKAPLVPDEAPEVPGEPKPQIDL